MNTRSSRCLLDQTTKVGVWRREAYGKRYQLMKESLVPLARFAGMKRGEIAAMWERELNQGLLCHEAEVAWPRKGEHNKPTFKVHVLSASGTTSI